MMTALLHPIIVIIILLKCFIVLPVVNSSSIRSSSDTNNNNIVINHNNNDNGSVKEEEIIDVQEVVHIDDNDDDDDDDPPSCLQTNIQSQQYKTIRGLTTTTTTTMTAADGNNDDNKIIIKTNNNLPSSSKTCAGTTTSDDNKNNKDDVVVVVDVENNNNNDNQEEEEADVVALQNISTIVEEQKRKLPDMSQGGVVFFLHIPKTGGTTVRRNIEKFDHINYIFAKNYSTYWETSRLVEDAIIHGGSSTSSNSTTAKKILFYEIHATDSPSFYKLRNKLIRWKETTANHNSIPIWFFTLIRNPIDYAFSHFNFFHIQKRNPTFEQCNATIPNLLRLSLVNPQCQFLYRGEPSMRAQNKIGKIVTDDECDSVHQSLLQIMDWIGTTEDMSNITLPILTKLLNLPTNFTFQQYKVTKSTSDMNGVPYFGIDNVTSDIIHTIHTKSTKDLMFYETALQYSSHFTHKRKEKKESE